jgi:hypothetical protein
MLRKRAEPAVRLRHLRTIKSVLDAEQAPTPGDGVQLVLAAILRLSSREVVSLENLRSMDHPLDDGCHGPRRRDQAAYYKTQRLRDTSAALMRVVSLMLNAKSAPNAAAGLSAPLRDLSRVSSTARMLAAGVKA